MEVTDLPFNRHVGLEQAPSGSGHLVSLPEGEQYTNHLGTVHASALFAVAEAGSGVFLVEHFRLDEVVPVVRRVEAKFRKPAHGRVSARCSTPAAEVAGWAEELARRGRVLAPVGVEVVDEAEAVVMSATIEWFITSSQRG